MFSDRVTESGRRGEKSNVTRGSSYHCSIHIVCIGRFPADENKEHECQKNVTMVSVISVYVAVLFTCRFDFMALKIQNSASLLHVLLSNHLRQVNRVLWSQSLCLQPSLSCPASLLHLMIKYSWRYNVQCFQLNLWDNTSVCSSIKVLLPHSIPGCNNALCLLVVSINTHWL